MVLICSLAREQHAQWAIQQVDSAECLAVWDSVHGTLQDSCPFLAGGQKGDPWEDTFDGLLVPAGGVALVSPDLVADRCWGFGAQIDLDKPPVLAICTGLAEDEQAVWADYDGLPATTEVAAPAVRFGLVVQQLEPSLLRGLNQLNVEFGSSQGVLNQMAGRFRTTVVVALGATGMKVENLVALGSQAVDEASRTSPDPTDASLQPTE